MPTPSGLPKAGDKLRFKPTGELMTVVKREGNDALYSLILRPDSGKLSTAVEAYGHPGCYRLLEAGYWLSSSYELVV